VRNAQGFACLDLKTMCRRFGGLSLKTIGDGFDQFRPQNRGVEDK
jgi:hypothetical protein